MSRIIVALLMRNEAARFLRSALDTWSTFADRIVVLDDNSDDNSWEIARGCIKVDPLVRRDEIGPAWGTEAPARAQLWDMAWQEAREGDWTFVLDADMTPAFDPRGTFGEAERAGADAVAFALYDLWEAEPKLRFRHDTMWRGHMHPRVWAAQKNGSPPHEGWAWNARGVHCGHFPYNLRTSNIYVTPAPQALLHYGYCGEDIRTEKAERYDLVASQLSEFERTHARSILDPEPRLLPLPFEPQLRLERPKHAYAI